MTAAQALAFVEQHGVVLQSARGAVPSLAAAVAGEPIRGSWWSHPRGKEIFRLTQFLADSADVLTCKLVDGKLTYVHRRLWPAVVRLADRFKERNLAALHDEHTSQGFHRTQRIAFPKWVPRDVAAAAVKLTEAEAERALPAGLLPARMQRARSTVRRKPSARD